MTKEKTQEAPPRLATRLARAMAAIKGVSKDGHNAFHRYDYATSDAVLIEARRALAEQGVFLLCSVADVLTEPRQAQKGTNYHVTLRLVMSFICGETDERLDAHWVSEAMDSGDKAMNKAQTAGLKYFLLKTFLIPTTDEPDADAVSPEPTTPAGEAIALEDAQAAIAQASNAAELAHVAARIKHAPMSIADKAKLRRAFSEKEQQLKTTNNQEKK